MRITFNNYYEGNFECEKGCIEDVLLPFAEMMNLPIILENVHGNYRTPSKSRENLHIYFWSSANENRKHDRFPENTFIFGSKVRGSAKDGFHPENNEVNSNIISLVCPEGHVAAEYHIDRPNSLHVLYDLPHQNELDVKIQLAGIMNEYYLLTQTGEKALLDLIAKIKEEKAKKNRDSNNRLYGLKEKLLFLEMKIAEKNEKRMKAENLAKEIKRKEKEQFEKIKKEARITSADGYIKIKTAEGDTIILNLGTGFYEVSVGQEKIPFHAICAGPAKAGLAQFIGARQYYAAFQIIKKWIQNHKNKRSA